METIILQDPLIRLSRDLKFAATKMGDEQARYLVDAYYQLQGIRVAENNQIKAMEREVKEREEGEKAKAQTETKAAKAAKSVKKNGNGPTELLSGADVLDWFCRNTEALEGQMKRALDAYSDAHEVGRWAKSIHGIGPVIAAGLLAHIDMEPWMCMKHKFDPKIKSCTVHKPHPPEEAGCGKKRLLYAGQVWNFAGIGDPARRWEKGERRPWNAQLKTLTWKIGQSFLKGSTNENCFYGLILRNEWEKLKVRNENLEFAAAAKEKLERFKIGKNTDAYAAYSVGKLPPAHVLQRACRYATKLFLSHYHCVAYESKFHEKAALPYIIAIGGHKDYIAPPNWPMAE
jgi:hypothetical protein